LLLWGPVGTGKTHAIAALVRRIIVKAQGGVRVERVAFSTLLRELRECFRPEAERSEMDALRPYLSAEILWLEDLGADQGLGAQSTDFAVRTAELLIDGRMEQEKPTFVTSNLSVESLKESFDERIASRLCTFTIIKLVGCDRRKSQGGKVK
jgi:DNA replication protein DnaC